MCNLYLDYSLNLFVLCVLLKCNLYRDFQTQCPLCLALLHITTDAKIAKTGLSGLPIYISVLNFLKQVLASCVHSSVFYQDFVNLK